MYKKQKLELNWIGKQYRPQLEPRILVEDSEKSYHAAVRFGDKDIFDNVLIHGDNLLALKALEAEFLGKVKCVVIDPPYNTGSAFSQYDDGLEHSIWLGLMRDRLEIIRKLLSEDGSLWITIDDNEAHYLKVLCDEVFGRSNFVANVVWQKKFAPQANVVGVSDSHDHILAYAVNKPLWRPNLLPRTDEADARYSNIDKDPRGPWMSDNFTISLTGGARGAQYAKTGVSSNIFEITTPSGRKIMPTQGRCWGASKERFEELVAEGRIWFGTDGGNVPRIKRFLSEVQSGVVARSWWPRDEVGDNQESKREASQFNSEDVFATPKPERLIRRILQIATRPGDLVLDSFAGSGTTGAVAHKMGCRWIMVELGNHCVTHVLPRLQMVVDGTDEGGITKAVSWNGGGGFRFYSLGPSLLEKDKWGREIISSQYDAAMLTQALCKLEGFTYAPNENIYWQQGFSSESDFLYVTTQTLGPQELSALSDDVGENRSLLVLCAAFRGDADDWSNLTIRKIPNHIRKKCEWGRDDYSLNVSNLPQAKSAITSPQSELFNEGDLI